VLFNRILVVDDPVTDAFLERRTDEIILEGLADFAPPDSGPGLPRVLPHTGRDSPRGARARTV
jgi:hypothetical protein